MSRRGQAPAAIAGLVALSVLLGALASLARRNAPPVEEKASGPYIESFEGAVQRNQKESRVSTAGGAGGEAALGGAVNGATAPATGGAFGAPPVAARGVPGRPAPAASAPRLSAAVSTELGRELAQLLANADVSVLAIGHKGGSFAYSQTDGWLRLDGNTWVVTDYASLPNELQAAYPPQVYAAGGSAKLQAGKGAGARQSQEGAPTSGAESAVPFDPKKAVVAYEPTPIIEQEPKKKGKKAEPVDF